MKKRIILLVILIIGLVYLVFSMLLVQPQLIEGNYLKLDKNYTHHIGDVWEVKFSPNDTLMISGGIEQNTKIWNRITGEVIHNLPHEIGSPSVDFSPKEIL